MGSWVEASRFCALGCRVKGLGFRVKFGDLRWKILTEVEVLRAGSRTQKSLQLRTLQSGSRIPSQVRVLRYESRRLKGFYGFWALGRSVVESLGSGVLVWVRFERTC